MSYKRCVLLISPILLLFLNSCFKATEDAPEYVRINNFTLKTDSTEGTSSSKIVDGWIYLDGKLLGVFQLPTTIPVLAVGAHTLIVNPGVLNSGVESARLPYPFYESYTNTYTFAQDKRITLNPSTRYKTDCVFQINEGFEDGIPFQKATGSDTAMIRITDPAIAFEGNSCAAIIVDGTNDISYSKSKNNYTLTSANSEIYLEMNYNSNCDLNFGIIGAQSGTAQSIAGFYSTGSVWKKTYIELSRTIHEVLTNDTKFTLYFIVNREGDRTKDYKVYIDNVKLVNTK